MKLSDGQRAGMRLADWHAHYMRLYGVTPRGHKAWTEEEVELLTRLYPDYDAARQAMPWRTKRALEGKASKLGICASRRVWQDGQWVYAKPLYRRGDSVRGVIAPAVDKAPRQVWSKAAQQGVRRPRRPPKPTAWPLINEVRMEAFRQRLTMTDLDELAGTGTYFRRPSGIKDRPIRKAIAMLSGRLMIEWDHD